MKLFPHENVYTYFVVKSTKVLMINKATDKHDRQNCFWSHTTASPAS